MKYFYEYNSFARVIAIIYRLIVTNYLHMIYYFNILHFIMKFKQMKTTIMLRTISACAFFACLLFSTSCKDNVKPNEVETRKEISKELENAGLQKKSHHDDEVIAAMNVIYKTPFASLNDDNKATLSQWNDAIGYNGAEDLYNDIFASFNISEQVGSLIKEYSEVEHPSVYERDVYNQAVSLLFQKENDNDAYLKTINTFTEIAKVSQNDLTVKGSKVDHTTWNKGMSKNFAEYWYVHSARILDANSKIAGTTLNDFLNRKPS